MSSPEDVVVVPVMMTVMSMMVAVMSDSPKDVVMTGVVSVVSVMGPMVSMMTMMAPMVSVMTVMVSVVSSRGPEDVGVAFLSGRIFILFLALARMHDVMIMIGDDKHHLSVREKLIQVLGSHLELRDEVDHLLGDVFCSHSQLHNGHVLALLVTESGVPQLVDGFVIRFEGLFGIHFLAG